MKLPLRDTAGTMTISCSHDSSTLFFARVKRSLAFQNGRSQEFCGARLTLTHGHHDARGISQLNAQGGKRAARLGVFLRGVLRAGRMPEARELSRRETGVGG